MVSRGLLICQRNDGDDMRVFGKSWEETVPRSSTRLWFLPAAHLISIPLANQQETLLSPQYSRAGTEVLLPLDHSGIVFIVSKVKIFGIRLARFVRNTLDLAIRSDQGR